MLLKVRFSLLSEQALKYISNCDSIFSEEEDYVNIIKTNSVNKENLFQNKSSSCYTNRSCGQASFNVLVCGGYKPTSNTTVASVKQTKVSNFNKIKTLSSMIEQRCGFEAVYLKGDVYVFGGRNKASNFVKSVEKYSPSTNEWTVVTNMIDERLYLCACAFISKIFILGGYFYNNHGGFSTNSSCLEFNTKCDNFKEITRMNEARERAACAVYRGNVVFSGGLDNDDNELNSAEYYDAFAYEWTPMPNMVNSHSDHSLVVVKDKLLVVGQGTDCCEVFDVICKKFVAIKLV